MNTCTLLALCEESAGHRWISPNNTSPDMLWIFFDVNRAKLSKGKWPTQINAITSRIMLKKHPHATAFFAHCWECMNQYDKLHYQYMNSHDKDDAVLLLLW